MSEEQGDLFEVKPHEKILDDICKEKIAQCPNVIVPWILMASYLYYIHDFSILSDGLFDELCRNMMYNYGDIIHRHKGFITLNHLAMGSLYTLTENEYPSMTKDAALSLVWDHYQEALRPESRILTFEDGPEIFVP